MPEPDVHPTVARLGAYSWRLIAIGIVAWVAIQVLATLRIVVFPIIVALFLTVVLTPPAHWLKARGLRPLLAVWTVFLGFLGLLALAGFLIVPALADEFADLGPTVEDGVDSVENWLVEESPSTSILSASTSCATSCPTRSARPPAVRAASSSTPPC